MGTKEKVAALAEIIKTTDEVSLDSLDKAMLLKTAVQYFEARAQTEALRDMLHKAMLQGTQAGEIKFN